MPVFAGRQFQRAFGQVSKGREQETVRRMAGSPDAATVSRATQAALHSQPRPSCHLEQGRATGAAKSGAHSKGRQGPLLGSHKAVPGKILVNRNAHRQKRQALAPLAGVYVHQNIHGILRKNPYGRYRIHVNNRIL